MKFRVKFICPTALLIAESYLPLRLNLLETRPPALAATPPRVETAPPGYRATPCTTSARVLPLPRGSQRVAFFDCDNGAAPGPTQIVPIAWRVF
jgi:hypothetical protein